MTWGMWDKSVACPACSRPYPADDPERLPLYFHADGSGCRRCTGRAPIPVPEDWRSFVPPITGKRCNVCHERKPLDAFSRERKSVDTYRGMCRDCDQKGRDIRYRRPGAHEHRLRMCRGRWHEGRVRYAQSARAKARARERSRRVHRLAMRYLRGTLSEAALAQMSDRRTILSQARYILRRRRGKGKLAPPRSLTSADRAAELHWWATSVQGTMAEYLARLGYTEKARDCAPVVARMFRSHAAALERERGLRVVVSDDGRIVGVEKVPGTRRAKRGVA